MYQFLQSSITASVLVSSLLVFSTTSAVEPKPHKVGATEVTTLITSSFGYGDNVFRGSDNETSSSFFALRPIVEAVRETAEQRMALGYEGNGFAFFDSSDDNYFSNKLSGDYARMLTSVSEFSLGASFEDGSTIRGTDITEGSNGDLEGATDFTRKDFSLAYAVGSAKVGPSLELGYNYTDLEFDNFEQINRGRDYALDEFSARLGYQYSVATKFFLDLSYGDYDYDAQTIGFDRQLDNSERAILVGVKWKLSRLTSGEISVGSIDKEFDNFQDPSSFTSWKIQLEWTPSARDTVTVESFSRPFEQAGTGLFQDVDQSSVTWVRDLSPSFSIKGAVTLGSVDFGTVERDDDYDAIKIGLLYKSGRYSEWSLNYEREDKNSNLPRFDFETNSVFLSYSVSL